MAGMAHDSEDSYVQISKLTTENLHNLNFSRAQIWSEFMNDITERDDINDVLNIDDVDSLFGPSDEEKEDERETKGFEIRETEIKNEIKNDSGLDLTVIEQNLTLTNAEKVLSVIAENPDATQFVSEDREFLELTLPFFENYNREMRESGIYNVLGSFDTDAINRNTYALERRRARADDISSQTLPSTPAQFWGRSCHHRIEDSESDSDSIDTARYIRSSKRESKATKRFTTKKTTIKSYRTIKSKRDELRKKYSYLVSDEIVHCSVAHCCRSLPQYHSFYHSIDERRRYAHYGHDSNSSLSSNASFDDTEFLYGTNRSRQRACYAASHCNSLTNLCASLSLTSAQIQHGHCQCQALHKCGDSIVTPLRNQSRAVCESIKKANKRIERFSERPTAERRATLKIKAVRTNSENSQKALELPTKKLEKQLEICAKSESEESEEADATIKMKLPPKTSKNNNEQTDLKESLASAMTNESKNENCEQFTNIKKKTSSTNRNRVLTEVMHTKTNDGEFQVEDIKIISSSSSNDSESEMENSFENALQLALKASQETYLAELEKRQGQKRSVKTNAESKPMSESKKPVQKNPVNTIFPKNHKFQPTLTKILSECESEDNSKHKKNKRIKKRSSQIKRSKEKLRELESRRPKTNLHSSENTTFFSNISTVCNSTAMAQNSTSTAKMQQIKKVMRCNNKNQPGTFSTSKNDGEKPTSTKALPKPRTRLNAVKLKSDQTDEGDEDSSESKNCMIVSSTSDPTAQKSLSINKSSLHAPKTQSNTSRVLLYAPHCDTTLVPDCSFVNDKYHLTLEHLSSVIGCKHAKVFFRYYKGKRVFKLTSTVYYEPPHHGYYSGNDTSESDIDLFDVPDVGKIVEDYA